MRSVKLKCCVVTGSRAEYGLFLPLLRRIKEEQGMELQLVVTGMHLSPEFGLTYKQIEADRFVINEKVEMLLSADTDTAITKSTALGLIGFADAFERLKPDWIILLGDRFETFAAAIAAHLAKVPVAHLHGGEITEGATDDAMRHAITKMSFLHFTSTEDYRKRVIQLGESPKRVFNVGAIGLETLQSIKLLSKKEIETQLNMKFGKENFLITYHPVTLENQTAEKQITHLLKALDAFKEVTLIFTMPNADAGGRVIMNLLEGYSKKYPGRVMVFTSLGYLRYLSMLKQVQVVIGNSSSGIIEVPEMQIPTINIGSRQQGRIRGKTIIESKPDAGSIIKAIRKAQSPDFRSQCNNAKNPYKKDGTDSAIINHIYKAGKLSSIQKTFFDL